MDKRLISLVVAGVLVSSASVSAASDWYEGGRGKDARPRIKERLNRLKEENREFAESLKNMSPEERIIAIVERQKEQSQKWLERKEEALKKRLERLRERLAQTDKLTESQKTNIFQFVENKYRQELEYGKNMAREYIVFIERIANDSDADVEQKKVALKVLLQSCWHGKRPIKRKGERGDREGKGKPMF